MSEDSQAQKNDHRQARQLQNNLGPKLITALLLICIGILLTLNNFGLVPWGVWRDISRFWPLLLVIFGLRLYLGKGILSQIITGIMTIAVIVALFVYSISYSHPTISSIFSIK